MQDSVQEIKGKLDIQDVVAPYVQLKKAGKYLKACCPFHQEKTPSFFVSQDRQLAYCFSCQKGGDMFQFIQDIEGVDFRGALEILAEKANVELKGRGEGGGGGVGRSLKKDKKAKLKAVNRDASKFFVQALWDGAGGGGEGAGEKVLSYLRGRKVTDEVLKEFQVGFVPEGGSGRDQVYRYLLEKGHEKEDILASTVAVARDSESRLVSDRFWLRLMFPIDNVQGDIIGFGGRALKKGDNPKYLNSPEYALYDKGGTLYNLSRAKAAIRERDLAVFVEGYFDVMASWQAGVTNVVATSGTALTEKQFKLIKRYTKRVALAFDADRAGQDALMRAIHTAQGLGSGGEFELFVIEIAGGKDASDLVKEDPELWVKAVEAKKPYLEFFEERFKKEFGLDGADGAGGADGVDGASAEGKRKFTDAMLELLKGVRHPVELDHYVKDLSKLVGTPVDMLYDYLNELKSSKLRGGQRSVRAEIAAGGMAEQVKKSKKDRLLQDFFGLILAYPKEFLTLWEQFENFAIFSKAAEELELVLQMNKISEERFKGFYEGFPKLFENAEFDFDASSVYKQILDHYNLHAEIDESFYRSDAVPDALRVMAFRAEKKNPHRDIAVQELKKLITLLYFEYTP